MVPALMPFPRCWNERMETLDPQALREIQTIKLRRQLEYVRERSPFYRRKLAAAGVRPEHVRELGDLPRLPFTEKDELRERQEAEPPLGDYACVPLDGLLRIHASSGTSGRPSYVGITRRDWEIWREVVARVYWSEGIRPNSRVVMGFGMGFFVGGLPAKDAIEHIGALFIPIGTGASDRLLTAARDIRADVLCCTPSAAIYLADYARDKLGFDARELGIRRICSGAEPGVGIPSIRDRIESAWGATITEGYGNADLLAVFAAECEERTGNHFLAGEYLYPELIDPDTGAVRPWEDGAQGELVITHLDRDCVPLLRFRTRDHVVAATTPCPCGRTGVRLRCVGRTDDMLIVLGVNVFPSAIKDVVSAMRPETTGEIEILLDAPGPRVAPPLRIRVEHGADVADRPGLAKRIEQRLRDRLIFQPSVELVPSGTLPRYEMKARLIRKLYE
jgi:phenylacetate-CoA ligase